MKCNSIFVTLLLCFAFVFTNATAQDNYDATTMGKKVYLETANWGQNSPFNKQIFTQYGGSTNAKAGCVPTAYAIVMRYHGFPTEGTSETLYNCQATTYVEITDRVYDFNKMPLTNGNGWNEEQIAETSKFFSHVLHACLPSYIGTSKTTVNEGQNSKVLNDYFNYQLVNASYQANFTMEQWIGKIKESIDNGCPIPYASDNSGTGDTRHMFVIDGYTANNYFHFNFGWAGSGNGWFKLDDITPSQGDDYSWKDGAEHYALFNLAPNKTKYPVTATVSPENAGTVTVSPAEQIEGGKVTLTATANSGYSFENWTKGTDVVGTAKVYKPTVATSGNDYVANFVAVSTTEKVNVTVSYDSSKGAVTYNDGAISGTGILAYKNAEVTLTATPVAGCVLSGWSGITASCIVEQTANSITFRAEDNINVTANFSNEVLSYTISPKTGTPNNASSFNWNWSYTSGAQSVNHVAPLTMTVPEKSNSDGRINILSDGTTISLGVYGANTPTTFTISVPEDSGYEIVGYSLKFKAYKDVVVNGTNYTNNTTSTLSASNLTTKSVDIVVNSTDYSGAIDIAEGGFTVSIRSTGGSGSGTVTPEPEVKSYTVTATAGTGGSVSPATQTVESGKQATVTATANAGYHFVGWTVGATTVSTNATYTFTVSSDVQLVANFEADAVTPEPVTGLEGKYYRLKHTGTTGNGHYLYVYDNNWHEGGNSGSSGVQVADLDENSDKQIFYFEKSGNGYKLKQRNGDYIYCYKWFVNSASNAENAPNPAVLYFEAQSNNNEYKIYWDNTFFDSNTNKESDDYLNVQNVSSANRVFCNVASTAASTWVLEEVTIDDSEGGEDGGEGDVEDTAGTLDVSFDGAAWKKIDKSGNIADFVAGGWGYQVAVSTSPAITLEHGDINSNTGYKYNNIGRSGNYPMLCENGGNYLIKIADGYVIKGYSMTVTGTTGTDLSFSYTVGAGVARSTATTQTATVTGATDVTIEATGLNTNEITLNFGSGTVSTSSTITITALEIDYAESVTSSTPFFKVEIAGWTENNPNTHLGTMSIGSTAIKLNPEHQTASELGALSEGTVLSISRKYRGYTFNGFFIGETSLGENPTLTAENVAAISETTPLVAKFTATDEVTLFYDDDEFSYRIPAIATTSTGKIIAVSDYRHNLDDVGRNNHGTGTLQVDLVMRTSNDNGKTWTAKETIAEGNSNFGYGDAAIAVNGENVLVMAVAGDVFYGNATSSSKQRTYRIYSTDGGESWTKEEVSSNLYSLFPNKGGMFFGSGKLVVDPDFNGTGKARVYGAMLIQDDQNYVLYSDDWGATWNILGGVAPANVNEPKVEILPSGQILLSARRNGGRTFNVFTYSNKATSEGGWNTAVNGCNNNGSSCNGEVFCIDAKRANGTMTKLLLQSQPKGSSRTNVTIWYKELSEMTYTASSVASGWTEGLNVSPEGVESGYSAMTLQENGEIGFFFEEAPCYDNSSAKGYSMVYVPLTIEEITNNAYLNPNTEVTVTAVTVKLTDAQGNVYAEDLDCDPSNVNNIVSALTTKYPFVTLGTGNYNSATNTYTNTVELPFKVSNSNNTYWNNIYYPAYGTSPGEFCPAYWSAEAGSDIVKKLGEMKHYGESVYNVSNYSDNISWAIYSVNNSLTFKFKNKLNNKYVKTTSGATGSDGGENVQFTSEISDATAFSIVNDKSGLENITTIKGEYSIASNGGYVCMWSTSKTYVTYTTNNDHAGGWVIFVDAPDYEALIAEVNNALAMFGDAPGKYTPSTEDSEAIANAKTAMENSGSVTLNNLNSYKTLATEALERATLNPGTPEPEVPEVDERAGYYRIAHEFNDAVTSIDVNKEYTLQCYGGHNGSGYIGYVNGAINGQSTEGTTIKFIAATGGGYYIKCVEAGKYISVDETANPATLTITDDAVTAWKLVNNTHTSNTVSFCVTIGTNTYSLNNAAGTNNIQVKNHGGAPGSVHTCSLWKMKETSPRTLYVQSTPCGISGYENAMLMTENTGAESIFYFDGSKLLSYKTGTYVNESGTTFGLMGVGVEGGDVTITDNNDGTCTIQASRYMHANNRNGIYYVDHCSNAGCDGAHNFVMEKLTELPVEITDAGYATFYAPVAVRANENVKVYYLAEGDVATESAVMTEIASKEVPANCAVVLQGAKGTYNFEVIDEAQAVEGNILTGTVAAAYISEDGYVLSKPEGAEGAGLYKAEMNQENNTAFLSNSHKAYLPVTAVPETELATTFFRFSFRTNSHTLAVSAAGYATLYLGFDAVIPELGDEEGVYIVESVSNGYAKMTEVTGVLPANTGVIVKAAAGEYEFTEATEGVAEDFNRGLLMGSFENEYVAGDAYVLSKQGGVVGLYKALLNKDEAGNAGTTHFLNNANKVYLPATALNGASLSMGLRFDFGGTTAIEEVDAENESSDVIYDLQGRRISEITESGIYVVNGKKVLVK